MERAVAVSKPMPPFAPMVVLVQQLRLMNCGGGTCDQDNCFA